VCDGCERNCFKPVDFRAAYRERPAYTFISCDEPEDMGRIPVDSSRLEQWQITDESLARAVTKLLGFSVSPQVAGPERRWGLGLLKSEGHRGEITLHVDKDVELTLAGETIRLANVLSLEAGGLKIDIDALIRVMDGNTRQPASGVGSPAWLKRRAQAAANARHSKPGGSRDKQDKIRTIWASGKYTTRDICAEQESAALDMSFAAARRALRNTSDPERPS
jgi:hypothetical protein